MERKQIDRILESYTREELIALVRSVDKPLNLSDREWAELFARTYGKEKNMTARDFSGVLSAVETDEGRTELLQVWLHKVPQDLEEFRRYAVLAGQIEDAHGADSYDKWVRQQR